MTFCERSETGLQLLARLGARVPLTNLEPKLFGEGPRQKEIYEFHGGEGCAKTEMCMNLAIRCILPKSWRGVDLNGKDAEVVFIDTEYKFSILRFTAIMDNLIQIAVSDLKTRNVNETSKSENELNIAENELNVPIRIQNVEDSKKVAIESGAESNVAEIKQKSPESEQFCTKSEQNFKENRIQKSPESEQLLCTKSEQNVKHQFGIGESGEDNITTDEIETFIKECLTKLHVIQTNGHHQLLQSLNALNDLMCSYPKISLLIIDSLSSFYWIERTNNGGKYSSFDQSMKKIVKVLSPLVENFSLICIVTTASLFNNKHDKASDDYNESSDRSRHIRKADKFDSWDYVGQAWCNFVTFRWRFTKHIVKSAETGHEQKEYTVVKNSGKIDRKVMFTVNDGGVSFKCNGGTAI